MTTSTPLRLWVRRRSAGADAPSAPGRRNSPHPIAAPAQARQLRPWPSDVDRARTQLLSRGGPVPPPHEAIDGTTEIVREVIPAPGEGDRLKTEDGRVFRVLDPIALTQATNALNHAVGQSIWVTLLMGDQPLIGVQRARGERARRTLTLGTPCRSSTRWQRPAECSGACLGVEPDRARRTVSTQARQAPSSKSRGRSAFDPADDLTAVHVLGHLWRLEQVSDEAEQYLCDMAADGTLGLLCRLLPLLRAVACERGFSSSTRRGLCDPGDLRFPGCGAPARLRRGDGEERGVAAACGVRHAGGPRAERGPWRDCAHRSLRVVQT